MRTLFIASMMLVACSQSLSAGPGCFPEIPKLNFTEMADQGDVAILVEWKSSRDPAARAEKTTDVPFGFCDIEIPPADQPEQDWHREQTGFAVVELLRGDKTRWQPGVMITYPRQVRGKPGDLFLLQGDFLPGTKPVAGGGIDWAEPEEISRPVWQYIKQAPATTQPAGRRLQYFFKSLENPDISVAEDAYQAISRTPIKTLMKLSAKLPRKQLRALFTNPQPHAFRQGNFGLWLGLCGNKEDVAVLRRYAIANPPTLRLNADCAMAGYLLLTGEQGLRTIEATKLVPEQGEVPFSETYYAMQALQFMWNHGAGKIRQERLKESMRRLLDRPDLSDLVIADLARWKDWSVRDRLMKLYGAEGYEVPAIKRAIVRFMLVCANDTTKTEDDKTPEHVTAAEAYLKKLREDDPVTVRQAEKYFVLK